MTRSTTEPRVVMTERDGELLVFVGLMGAGVTSEHLAVAFFAGADRARRRLKQLVDAGYLDSWLIDSRAPRVMTLSARGLAYAVDRFPDLAPRLRRAKPVLAQALEHASAVIWCRMYLAALADAGQLSEDSTGRRKTRDCPTHRCVAQSDVVATYRRLTLSRFYAPLEPDAAQLGFARFGLRPDGIAVLDGEDDGTRIVLACEADLAHESLEVLRTKASRYARAEAAGAVDAVWWFVSGGSRRVWGVAQMLSSEATVAPICRLVGMEFMKGRPVAPPREAVLSIETVLARGQYTHEGEAEVSSRSARLSR